MLVLCCKTSWWITAFGLKLPTIKFKNPQDENNSKIGFNAWQERHIIILVAPRLVRAHKRALKHVDLGLCPPSFSLSSGAYRWTRRAARRLYSQRHAMFELNDEKRSQFNGHLEGRQRTGKTVKMLHHSRLLVDLQPCVPVIQINPKWFDSVIAHFATLPYTSQLRL